MDYKGKSFIIPEYTMYFSEKQASIAVIFLKCVGLLKGLTSQFRQVIREIRL